MGESAGEVEPDGCDKLTSPTSATPSLDFSCLAGADSGSLFHDAERLKLFGIDPMHCGRVVRFSLSSVVRT